MAARFWVGGTGNWSTTQSIVDSYSESNFVNSGFLLGSLNNFGCGQSFTGNGGLLNRCKFFMAKAGSPTGNALAKVYAHSGVFGTSSVPTGSALATSNTFDVSALTSTETLTTFTFSGANQITLTNGTNYVVTLEYNGGDASNYIDAGNDITSPTHAGNATGENSFSVWIASSTTDLCFYVYTDGHWATSSGGVGTAAVPTSSDNVTFDANSFSFGSLVVSFNAGVTQSTNAFAATGTAGNLITFQSTGPGTPFTLSQASGTVNGDYLSISDSTATGGATWNAGAHSTNGGGNTGWFFSTLVAGIFDSPTITDVTTVFVPNGASFVFDSNIISEQSTPQLVNTINIFDSITIAETVTPTDVEDVSVFNSITVAESTTILSSSLSVNVFDNVTIGDITTSTPTQLTSTGDDIQVSESITILQKNLVASVFDSITITETATPFIATIPIIVFDSILVSEQIGIHRIRTGYSANWTPSSNTSSNWISDTTTPTSKWKRTP